MADDRTDVLLIGPKKPVIVEGLAAAFNLHVLADARDADALIAGLAPRLRAALADALAAADVSPL